MLKVQVLLLRNMSFQFLLTLFPSSTLRLMLMNELTIAYRNRMFEL
ncbi:hypothetical protein WL1483_3096 [Aeromonas schubertii]|uniref:Uncharacterized protein n=1 Tax=Aeromonas schubertii TaxID=652 RepID=A0A0S2SLB2_9GAMM|nr:hypothetical protein WL1483_3096 [Aeromonas schubertii]